MTLNTMQLLEQYKIQMNILISKDVQLIMLNVKIRLLKSLHNMSLYLCAYLYIIVVGKSVFVYVHVSVCV